MTHDHFPRGAATSTLSPAGGPADELLRSKPGFTSELVELQVHDAFGNLP